MLINDKIRDEKLQYDIKREGAKISALSSGTIDNYEYLTGEEILSSYQRRVIEQAKFTYSLLGKAYEKQTKTIEEQWRKQVGAIEEHGKQLIKSNVFTEKSIPLDNQKGIFHNLVAERTGKIEKLYDSFNFQNLIYHFKVPTKDIDFNNFIDAETLFDDQKS